MEWTAGLAYRFLFLTAIRRGFELIIKDSKHGQFVGTSGTAFAKAGSEFAKTRVEPCFLCDGQKVCRCVICWIIGLQAECRACSGTGFLIFPGRVQ